MKSDVCNLSDDDEGGYNDGDVTSKEYYKQTTNYICLSNYSYAGTIPMSGMHLECGFGYIVHSFLISWKAVVAGEVHCSA